MFSEERKAIVTIWKISWHLIADKCLSSQLKIYISLLTSTHFTIIPSVLTKNPKSCEEILCSCQSPNKAIPYSKFTGFFIDLSEGKEAVSDFRVFGSTNSMKLNQIELYIMCPKQKWKHQLIILILSTYSSEKTVCIYQVNQQDNLEEASFVNAMQNLVHRFDEGDGKNGFTRLVVAMAMMGMRGKVRGRWSKFNHI